MEKIINEFKIYSQNNQNYVGKHFDHEDLVEDYMFNHHLQGNNIFFKLLDASKEINKDILDSWYEI